jgi:hypothetical protein
VTNAIGEPYESLRAIPIPVTAPGDRDHWIAIHVDQITGRRIH